MDKISILIKFCHCKVVHICIKRNASISIVFIFSREFLLYRHHAFYEYPVACIFKPPRDCLPGFIVHCVIDKGLPVWKFNTFYLVSNCPEDGLLFCFGTFCLDWNPSHGVIREYLRISIVSDNTVTLYDTFPSRDCHPIIPSASVFLKPFIMPAGIDGVLLFK